VALRRPCSADKRDFRNTGFQGEGKGGEQLGHNLNTHVALPLGHMGGGFTAPLRQPFPTKLK